MTESVPSSTGDLENLVAEYVSGVENRQTNDAQTWLPVRDQIEAQWDSLTPEQAGRVEQADETLVENAGEVAARMAATEGGALRDLRKATPHTPEQWWWYLDVLSHVSDQVGAAPVTQPQPWYSQLVVIIEWVVIAVAVFVIVRNLIPSLTQQNTGGSSAAVVPTLTPAPTETPDVSLFDMSTATTFKTPDGVVQLQMPKAWRFTPSATPGNYQFAAGSEFSPAATIQVAIDEPKTLYQNFRLTTEVNSPQDALNAIKAGVSPDANFQFSPIQPVKIGSLDGYGMTVSIPAGQQGAAQQIELRFAPAGSKMAFVELQAASSAWPTAKDTLYKMAESMVINAGAIPTATPTSTPHPLEITATAIQHLAETNQAQMNALTPTTTPIPTQAATGAASGPATASAGTTVPTTAATPAATAAATAAP